MRETDPELEQSGQDEEPLSHEVPVVCTPCQRRKEVGRQAQPHGVGNLTVPQAAHAEGLVCSHLEILNDFIFELVFSK